MTAELNPDAVVKHDIEFNSWDLQLNLVSVLKQLESYGFIDNPTETLKVALKRAIVAEKEVKTLRDKYENGHYYPY